MRREQNKPPHWQSTYFPLQSQATNGTMGRGYKEWRVHRTHCPQINAIHNFVAELLTYWRPMFVFIFPLSLPIPSTYSYIVCIDIFDLVLMCCFYLHLYPFFTACLIGFVFVCSMFIFMYYSVFPNQDYYFIPMYSCWKLTKIYVIFISFLPWIVSRLRKSYLFWVSKLFQFVEA